MFALLRRCQQLHLHDPGIKCKFFGTLVKPILCYGCDIWAIVDNKTDLDKLERIQQGFLKGLLGVQTQTTNLHVLAEFGRYPLQLSWQALAGKCMDRPESIDADRLLKQAFDADCRLPATKSWRSCYEDQLHNHLVSSRTEDMPHR